IKKLPQMATEASSEYSDDIRLVRKNLETGISKSIPCGSRNNTLLRLLGSDRGTRGLDYQQLLENAKIYRDTWCEEPETFSDSELRNLALTVSKYEPGFATSNHTTVNEN